MKKSTTATTNTSAPIAAGICQRCPGSRSPSAIGSTGDAYVRKRHQYVLCNVLPIVSEWN
jgi:hypothetical protein